MNKKKIVSVAAVLMMSLCTQTTSYILKEKSRVKKSITDYSKLEYVTVTNSSSTSNISDTTDASDAELSGIVKKYFTNVTTTTKAPMIKIDVSIFSAKFNECVYTAQAVSIDAKEYQKFPNGSVFVPAYKMVFDRSNHLINGDLLFICKDVYTGYTGEPKFPSGIETVSVVCVGISSACIILHILMFIFVKRLRNLPGYCLMSLCVALLLAYLFTVIQFEIIDSTDCTIIGMSLVYFFLASFFWMNTISYDVWRSIRMATTEFRTTSDRPIMVRFARYSIYAWGIPLVIIITAVIVHNTASDKKYTLIFNMDTCWFLYKQALIVYFIIPLFSLLGMNVIFFVSSFYMIIMASMSRSQSGSQTGSDLWSRLYLSLRLACVMGFMWIFGVIAAATEVMWLWYLYSVCNALQGVFIFFSFTVSERTRKACKKAFKERKFSLSFTQSSSHNTSSV